ncbi:hypothetical protein DJ010_12035 [Nocardioides silvaticus]|uniref:Uncharacterized protein n=1 Tax=Nocardioides silvaticus TaxID=2201891 RepID=A0A316TGY6_9ACTN|nr:hypothetical protein [Nocardioides silvaticus]PWN02469.1 hypothetical protein DJ010_12035 [Nocardioides silvaticus]
MNEQQVLEALHRVRDDIAVGPPPVLQVHAGAVRRRRARVAGLAAAAAVVTVAGVVTVGLVGGDEDGRPEPARQVENPAPVAWWGDGVLHVAHAEVEIARPWTMVDVGDGVVLEVAAPELGEQAESTLVHVTDDGTQSEIGTQTLGRRLVTDPDTGWVAWAVGSEGEAPELVVLDTRTGEEVGRRELPVDLPRRQVFGAEPAPIAIDDGSVYYTGPDGDYRWDVAAGAEPERVTTGDTHLLDVEAGTQLTTDDKGQVLVPGARYAVSQSGIGSQVRVFDVATGDRVPSGLEPDDAPDQIAFGTDGTITYAFSTPWRRPDDFDPETEIPRSTPPRWLVTCTLGTDTCTTVVDGIGGDEEIVLP